VKPAVVKRGMARDGRRRGGGSPQDADERWHAAHVERTAKDAGAIVHVEANGAIGRGW